MGIMMVFLVILCAIAGGFGILWGWTVFLETATPRQVRVSLYCTVALCTVVETGMWYAGMIKDWVLALVWLNNIWGLLDAALRFPIVYDVDTFFTLKQAVLVALKTVGYALGFIKLGKRTGWFLFALFVCVWTIPLLYLMALPIGDSVLQNAKTDSVDADITVRLYRLLMHPAERKEAMLRIRHYRHSVALWLATHVSFLRPLIMKSAPAVAQKLRTREV